MDKTDSIKEQIGNVSGDGNPKKNQKEMLAIKSTATEMKNVFDRLISRLNGLRKESLSHRIY